MLIYDFYCAWLNTNTALLWNNHGGEIGGGASSVDHGGPHSETPKVGNRAAAATDCHLLGVWQSWESPQRVPFDVEKVKLSQPAGIPANCGPEINSNRGGAISSPYKRDGHPHKSGKCQEGQVACYPHFASPKPLRRIVGARAWWWEETGPRVRLDVFATSQIHPQPSNAGSA